MKHPSPFEFVLLTLASFRVWRIAALDDVPPIPAIRNRLVGAHHTQDGWVFDRPTVAHMVGCPWCLGWWVSLAAWLCWRTQPKTALTVAAPLAVSATVGILGHLTDS